MKNLIFILIGCLLMTMSCTTDNRLTSSQGGTFQARLNGDLYESRATGATLEFSSSQASTLNLIGSDNLILFNGDLLQLLFLVPAGQVLEEKTYTFDSNTVINIPSEISAWLYYQPDDENEETAITIEEGQSGSLNVTVQEVDYRSGGGIRGTFTAVMHEEETDVPIVVTDGEFSLAIE